MIQVKNCTDAHFEEEDRSYTIANKNRSVIVAIILSPSLQYLQRNGQVKAVGIK
jgi:hypothetical protein